VIAAAVVSADLLSVSGTSQPTLTQLVVGAVSNEWLIDRLVQNVIAVVKLDGVEHFVRLPGALSDGRTFAAPPGSATRLSTSSSGTTYQTKDGVTLSFNSGGYLTSWANAAGATVTLTYNASNQITQVVNNLGRKLTFTYSGSNLASVSDVPASGTARTASYTYDSNGNLSAFTDVLG
jgi:hypothetical protein